MAKTAKKAAPPADEIVVYGIDDVPQRSEAWFALRRGIPTASRFATIMASGKDGGESVGRKQLLRRLAGEILSGETAETYQNEAMRRGVEMEPDARAYYERTHLVDLTPVGFVRRTIKNPLGSDLVVGCSPDSLIGKRKALEIKTMIPELLIDVAEKGAAGFPSEYRAQTQGTLWVLEPLGIEEIDLMIFYRGMPFAPTFTLRRDELYIAGLRDAVETFDYELRQLVKRMREIAR